MLIGPGLPDTAFFPRRRIAYHQSQVCEGGAAEKHMGSSRPHQRRSVCLEFGDASVPGTRTREATQKVDLKSAKVRLCKSAFLSPYDRMQRAVLPLPCNILLSISGCNRQLSCLGRPPPPPPPLSNRGSRVAFSCRSRHVCASASSQHLLLPHSPFEQDDL